MRYKLLLIICLVLLLNQTVIANTIDFGNSYFNKDRANTVSKIITLANTTDTVKEYTVSFKSHPSMQTSDIKTAPLTDEVLDSDTKEIFSSISKDSCIQHYGETLFTIAPGQKCKLHITFSPTEAKDYNEEMIITSDGRSEKYSIHGKGILMPDFTVLYYTDNSGENVDNKRAEYSIKWNNETAGVKSDKYAYIKIFKDNKKNSKNLSFNLEGDTAFQLDKSKTTCKINGSSIEEPENEPCGIVFSFRPTSAGDFTAKLVFNKTILSGTREYMLYGSASDMLDFGTVYFGGNVQKILIPNTTNNDQNYSILSESSNNNFKLVVLNSSDIPSCIAKNTETSFLLKQGQSCYLGFTFAPDKNADFIKKVIIMSNNGERREVTLTGKGVEKLQDN